MHAVTEVVAREKNQPGEWIEDAVLGIRRNRLSGGEVAVPVRKLAAVYDLAQNLLRRVVVAREIAHVKVVDADEHIAERERHDEGEGGDGEDFGATAHRGRGSGHWLRGRRVQRSSERIVHSRGIVPAKRHVILPARYAASREEGRRRSARVQRGADASSDVRRHTAGVGRRDSARR